MNHDEISEQLKGVVTWERATLAARAAFVYHMADCAYGREPTCQAWHWFNRGWAERDLRG